MKTIDRKKEVLVAKKKDYKLIIDRNKTPEVLGIQVGKKLIELPVDELREVIIKQFNTRPHELGIMDTETRTMQMIEVVKNIKFRADKDIAKDEEFVIPTRMMYPYQIALAEKMYNMAHINGDKIEVIPVPDLTDLQNQVFTENLKFVEDLHKIDQEKRISNQSNNTEKSD